jgi:hypothetical protein
MTNPRNFTMTLPDGWEDRTVYSYVGPDDSGLQHVITLNIDDSTKAGSAAEFARERIDATARSLPAAEIVKNEEKKLPNGTEAWEAVFKWMPADNMPRFIKQLYFVTDGVGYCFAGTFTKKTIKTIALDLDRIAASLRVVPKER